MLTDDCNLKIKIYNLKFKIKEGINLKCLAR